MSIGNFFASIWRHIEDLFSKLPSPLKVAVTIGYEAVNALKSVTDLDKSDLIGSVFGQFGKDVEDKVRAELPTILTELQLAKDCSDKTDPNEILWCALEVIKSLDPKFQAAFYHDLAVYISQLASDGELSWGDGVALLQWYYEHKK